MQHHFNGDGHLCSPVRLSTCTAKLVHVGNLAGGKVEHVNPTFEVADDTVLQFRDAGVRVPCEL